MSLYFLYRMRTDFKGRPRSEERTARALKQIAELLDAVKELAI